MSDIVERLRTGTSGFITWEVKPIDLVAADEIERLRDERDRMREALRYWLHDGEVRDFGEWFEVGCKIARAALKEKGHD
jgi:hypothetical protein